MFYTVAQSLGTRHRHRFAKYIDLVHVYIPRNQVLEEGILLLVFITALFQTIERRVHTGDELDVGHVQPTKTTV